MMYDSVLCFTCIDYKITREFVKDIERTSNKPQYLSEELSYCLEVLQVLLIHLCRPFT